MKTLAVDGIVKTYKSRQVVNNVSFNVTQREIVGLLGPNGAGKTTSFYVAAGLVNADSGVVYLDNRIISHLPMFKRARLGLSYLPQEASIFRKLTVEKNIMAILENMGMQKNKRRDRCDELLAMFNVDHIRKQMGYTLSGGERRRVEIARSLAADPKILLLDEPFAGVDPIAVQDMQRVIKKIQKLNIGILITDHNVRETLKIVSRAYIMTEGRVMISGTAKDLIRNKEARRIYLGEGFRL